MPEPAPAQCLARERSAFDGAVPAGGAVALMNAARLAIFTDNGRWRQVADRALAFYRPLMDGRPTAMAESLLAADFLAGPVREIALALPALDAASAEPFRRALRENFCPRKVLVVGESASSSWREMQERAPLLRGKIARDGRTTAYVCTQGRCDLPTTDSETFAKQIAT
jgi:uncharacterized protein